MKRVSVIRIGSAFSWLLEKKALILVILLSFFALFVLLVSTGVGEVFIPPADVFYSLIGSGDPANSFIIESLRLPRVLIALMVGAALGVSGAILQSVIRNPLASPDLLGITGGASVAAVGLITFFTDSNSNSVTVSVHWVPAAAFVGATSVAILIYVLAWKKGISPFRLVLLGIGFYTATQALINLIMLLGPVYRAIQSKTWLTGSIYGSNWDQVQVILPWLGILLPLSYLWVRHLNVQQLGDDVAKSLGSPLEKYRMLLLFTSTGLAGAAVSFAGAISFVGLIAPHAARRLVGADYHVLLPASALLGSIFVMLADLCGRLVLAPLEIPAGVFTAVIGAPYFIYLLYRQRD